MTHITVFTGLDKTGKTTLSKQFCSLSGDMSKWLHFSKPDKDSLVYFSEAIRYADMGYHVVCDRWAEGDYIYSEAMGHKPMFRNKQEYHDIVEAASNLGLTYIFCWDDVASIRKRFKKCGETFVPVEKIKKIQDLFMKEAHRMAKLNKFPVYLHRFGSGNFQLLNKINPSI